MMDDSDQEVPVLVFLLLLPLDDSVFDPLLPLGAAGDFDLILELRRVAMTTPRSHCSPATTPRKVQCLLLLSLSPVEISKFSGSRSGFPRLRESALLRSLVAHFLS